MKVENCGECGVSFEFEPIMYDGRELVVPKYCPSCSDRRSKANEAKLAREREKATRNRLQNEWARICPPLYAETDPSRLILQGAVAQVLGWQFGPRGLLLHGPTGMGKTRAAYLLLNRLHFREEKGISAFHSNAFSHQCARAFGDQQGEAWIARHARADVVFLDDLGKFKLTERVEAELFGLIEMRMANHRPIIVTTNFVGDGLESRLTEDRGAALVRRLRECCDTIAFV